METIYLSIQSSLTVTIIVGLFFIGLGYLNSKKTIDNRKYIIGNRDENTFSLTTSLAKLVVSENVFSSLFPIIYFLLSIVFFEFKYPSPIKKRPTIIVTVNDDCIDKYIVSIIPSLNYRSGSSGLISVF